jgi:hypothetical protein
VNLASLLSGAGVKVEIRSAVLPPIVLGDAGPPGAGTVPAPSSATAGGGASFLPDPLRVVQPAVTVDVGGSRVVSWAPHGEPPAAPWRGVAIALLVVGGLFGVGFAVGRWTS